MGNPQHLEWLLEGVEAWNTRREADDFMPDLSGFNIRRAFEDAGRLDNLSEVPLSGINLSDARLESSILDKANLTSASLIFACIGSCSLQEANLTNADLRKVQLNRQQYIFEALSVRNRSAAAHAITQGMNGPDLTDARLENANVRSVFIEPTVEGDKETIYLTDLSDGRFSQSQLEVMNGDLGTIIPFGLAHPTHWPVFEPTEGPQDKARSEHALLTTAPSETPGETKLPLVAKRSTTEIKLALAESYDGPAALAAYMAEQLQNEIAAHSMTAKPNEELAALNEWNAKHNFLTEMLASVTIIHDHLPVTEKPMVTEQDATSVRDALEQLGAQVQGAIEWLDTNPGTLGSFWKLGCITGASSLMAALGIPIAISAPIATGVIGANTVKVLFKKE